MTVSAKRAAPSEVDRGRLEQIFNAHHAAVWRALRRRGLAPEAAEDATQETFLLVAARLDDIPRESERAFVLGTAVRVAHTLGRKTVRWELDEDMDQRSSANRDTSERHADGQLCDLVLSKIDPDLVEVFVLYEIEGLTSPEIAQNQTTCACKLPRPISVVAYDEGSDNSIVPYNGAQTPSLATDCPPSGSCVGIGFPSAKVNAQIWAGFDGCGTTTAAYAGNSICQQYAGCTDSTTVMLCTNASSSHLAAYSSSTAKVAATAWGIFKDQTLP